MADDIQNKTSNNRTELSSPTLQYPNSLPSSEVILKSFKILAQDIQHNSEPNGAIAHKDNLLDENKYQMDTTLSNQDLKLESKLNDCAMSKEVNLDIPEVTETDLFLPMSKMNGNSKAFPKTLNLDLQFENLTYKVDQGKKKGYKTIIKEISGRFKSGDLNAILGPSGAGKTTMMNILAGYRTSCVSGEVVVNGKPRNLKSFRMQSCYIMQEDHLLPYLTVQESMEVAANLKLGNGVQKSLKKKVILDTLQSLSLSECKHTQVSSLSGGERKRLSIALELVNNPPIMFFDEPTSGLDSQTSYQCISVLRGLAQQGRNIIMTIHQPSARLFDKIDSLYAIAEGQCVYRGTVPGLVPFMSSLGLECPSYHNPADFLVEVASGEFGNYIPKLVEEVKNSFSFNYPDESKAKLGIVSNIVSSACNGGVSENHLGAKGRLNCGECVYSPKEANLDLNSCDQNFLSSSEYSENLTEYPASSWTQFYVLFHRTLLSITRDKMLTKLRLGAHIVVGIFIGILYYNVGNDASKMLSNVGCIFFCLMFLLFTALMPTILTFPIEMNVFIREHLNHWYSLKPYYMAKTMADMPFQIVFPILYVLIIYFLTNQPYEIDKFILFTIVCIMTSLVAQSIGLVIGAAMDMQTAVFFGPAITIPALIFSGFFVTFYTIPVYMRWLTFLSYVRYGYEASLIIIYGNEREPLDCSEPFCMFKYPVKTLEELDITESFLVYDLLLLLLYFLIIRVLGYYILLWKLRKER